MGDNEEVYGSIEYAGESGDRNLPQELEGVQHKLRRLGDITGLLNERWSIDDRDIGVIRRLSDFLGGPSGSNYDTQPGGIRGTEHYGAVIKRGSTTECIRAKCLLALIMELKNVDELEVNEYTGDLAQEDHGLEILKRQIVPYLVEDLAIYAGWAGYKLPSRIEHEQNHKKKREAVMNYTADWILAQLAEDDYMKHFVDAMEIQNIKNQAMQSVSDRGQVVMTSEKVIAG